jgi:hypothetical protein
MAAYGVTPTPTPGTRTVNFAWQASASPEVVGYKILWGLGHNNYQNVRDVKNSLRAPLTLSNSNTYYVTVLAYSMTDTSEFSNEVVGARLVIIFATSSSEQAAILNPLNGPISWDTN